MAKTLKMASGLLFVLIAAYLGAHYWIRWKNTVHDDVTKISSLVNCDPNEIRSLAITQVSNGKNEELIFERVDSALPGTPPATAYAQADWRFVAPALGEADATLLRRITSTICELYNPILLRKDQAPFSQPPALKLTASIVGKSGAEKFSFDFGNIGPDRMVVVVVKNAEGKEKTATIPLQLFQAASLGSDKYQNLRVMRTEADNIQTAVLRVNGKERFILERLGADWKLLVDGKDLGAASEEANRFVNRLATLRAVGVMEPAYGADRCRSGNAKMIFDVSGVAGRQESVRFDFGRGGEIAVCSTSRTMKFRVHRDLLKYLDISAKALAAI